MEEEHGLRNPCRTNPDGLTCPSLTLAAGPFMYPPSPSKILQRLLSPSLYLHLLCVSFLFYVSCVCSHRKSIISLQGECQRVGLFIHVNRNDWRIEVIMTSSFTLDAGDYDLAGFILSARIHNLLETIYCWWGCQAINLNAVSTSFRLRLICAFLWC